MTPPGDGLEPSSRTRIPDDGGSVVDDHTFDLLQALTSSLEALDAYREYAAGSPDSVFSDLAVQERAQAERLLAALRTELAGPR